MNDEAPGRPTSARSSLESFNRNTSLRAIFETICGASGFVFVNFALGLGVPKEQMGYVAAIASLACLLQMPGVFLTNSIRDKKGFTITLGLVEPVIMIASVLCLPFLAPPWRPPFLLIAVFAAGGTLHLTRPTTDEWFASVIPGGIRGRYLGRRLQIMSVTIVLSMIAAGHLSQSLDRTRPLPFALLMAVGGLFGILAVLALRRADMPAISTEGRVHLSDLPAIWKTRPFVRVVAACLLYNTTFYFAMPYYQVFYLQVMGMKESRIGYMLGIYFAIKILLSPRLGRMIDRIGVRHAVAMTIPIYTLFFASFVFCGPERAWPVWVAWAFTAVADATFFMAVTTALYDSIPSSQARRAYFVVYNLTSFGAIAVGAAAAAWILGRMAGIGFAVGSFRVEPLHLLFACCAIGMVPAGLLTLPLLPTRADRKARSPQPEEDPPA